MIHRFIQNPEIAAPDYVANQIQNVRMTDAVNDLSLFHIGILVVSDINDIIPETFVELARLPRQPVDRGPV